MSLLTPTGNPYPFLPGHILYECESNIKWLDEKCKQGESREECAYRLEAEFQEWAVGKKPDWIAY